MIQRERLNVIKKLLKQKHRLSTKELADYFNVSFDTARRDVLHLTSTGQAIRVHGGILELDESDVPNYLTRQHILSPIKVKMAKIAAHFIHENQCDFIGPSTTLVHLCQQIDGKDLEIVTNSVDNALALLTSNLPKVSLLGGELNKKNRYTHSRQAIDQLEKIRFNTAFIACARVRKDGVYLDDPYDAELIDIATSRARKVILVAENYKFTARTAAPYMSCSLDKIDVVITDTALPESMRSLFNKKAQIISVDS